MTKSNKQLQLNDSPMAVHLCACVCVIVKAKLAQNTHSASKLGIFWVVPTTSKGCLRLDLKVKVRIRVQGLAVMFRVRTRRRNVTQGCLCEGLSENTASSGLYVFLLSSQVI